MANKVKYTGLKRGSTEWTSARYYCLKYKITFEEFQSNRDKYIMRRKSNYLDTYRKVGLRNKYGLTTEDYDDLLKSQDCKCAICGKEEVEPHQSGVVKRLAVDHDHKSGKIRGLLCSRCNRAIGQLEDDPKLIAKALLYLLN